MTTFRPKVLIACDEHVRNAYLPPKEIERLETFADWEWFSCEGGSIYTTNENPEAAAELSEHVGEINGLVVCHGCPTITPEVLNAAPNLKIIGELEGDRFASRIDPGGRVGTGNPHGGYHQRLLLSSFRVGVGAYPNLVYVTRERSSVGSSPARRLAIRGALEHAGGLLTGKRVGLIGGGNMGRRLIKLLRPFEVDIWVYDPYLPRGDGGGYRLSYKPRWTICCRSAMSLSVSHR